MFAQSFTARDPNRNLSGALRALHQHRSTDPYRRDKARPLDEISNLHGFPPITTGMRSISGFIALP
jgi:hypothetical protein